MENFDCDQNSILQIQKEFEKEIISDLNIESFLSKESFDKIDNHFSDLPAKEEIPSSQFKSDVICKPSRKPTIGDLLPKVKPIKKYRLSKRNNKNLNEKSQKRQEKVSKKDQNSISSYTFCKRKVCRKWNEEESEYFFKCLKLFGTDFSLISQAMTNRDRKEIKVFP